MLFKILELGMKTMPTLFNKHSKIGVVHLGIACFALYLGKDLSAIEPILKHAFAIDIDYTTGIFLLVLMAVGFLGVAVYFFFKKDVYGSSYLTSKLHRINLEAQIIEAEQKRDALLSKKRG